MAKCSEEALETALRQLSDHAASNIHISNWMLTFLAAARMEAAGYENTIAGSNQAAKDLYAILPVNADKGSINPFLALGKSSRWRDLSDAGRKTVWNNGTRTNPQTELFNNKHFKYGLRDDAVDVLLGHLDQTTLPAREALAVFLTRDHEWGGQPTEEDLLEESATHIGLDRGQFKLITSERSLGVPIVGDVEWSPTLLARSELAPPPTAPIKSMVQGGSPETADEDPDDSFAWTRATSLRPLRESNVAAITERTLAILDDENIVLPSMKATIERCVTALLLGHLVLQGPPGTGKTSLARALCQAFEVEYVESTATSEWSPFHVIGGYRPNSTGGLVPVHGSVTRAVLDCAERVRHQTPDDGGADSELEQPQGTWLFIDEFNRADIDKAVGSLYTLLSSSDPQHLDRTPLDLWYEKSPQARALWVPARFRIIAAMNDLDTGFVNAISQGLTRRFQFVTINVPDKATSDSELSGETLAALASAHRWITETYPLMDQGTLPELTNRLTNDLQRIQNVLSALRHPQSVAGWPIGTAQLVDLLKYVLLSFTSVTPYEAIDIAFADRLIPRMSQIDDDQEATFRETLQANGLTVSAGALRHLLDPHSV